MLLLTVRAFVMPGLRNKLHVKVRTIQRGPLLEPIQWVQILEIMELRGLRGLRGCALEVSTT